MRWFLPLFLSLASHASMFRNANDAQVNDWLRRCAATTTMPVRVGTQIASTIYMRDIRLAGIYPGSRYRANLYSGDGWVTNAANLGTVSVPLIADKGGTVDVPTANVSTVWTYSESTGLKQNSPSLSFLDSGVAPSASFTSPTNIHLGVYIITSNNNSETDIGSYPFNGQPANIASIYVSNGGNSYSWLCSSGAPASASDSAGVGYYLGSAGSGSNTLYKAGSLIANAASGGGLPVTTTIYIYALHVDGATINFSTKTQGGYVMGSYLTDAQVTLDQAAMQRYQTYFGRQKP